MPKCTIAITVVVLYAGLVFAADLATYKSTYEKKLAEIVLSHGVSISASSKKYAESLQLLLDKVKREGDLGQYTAVMDEIRRFRKEKAIPDKVSTVPSIQTAQSHYAKQTSRHSDDKARKVITLAKQYDQALDRLQKELVVSGNIDMAKATQQERTRVKASQTYLESHALHSTSNREAERLMQERDAAMLPKKTQLLPSLPKQVRENVQDLEGLVLWHSCDKKSSRSTDKSKHRNHGRVNNANFTLRGKTGGAFSFIGVDSHIRVPNDKSLVMKDAFSLMAWARIEALQDKAAHCIMSRFHWSGGRGFGLTITPAGAIVCIFNGKLGAMSTPPGLVGSGEWVHIASIYDGNTLTCYVNGVPEVSRKRGPLVNNDSNLYIGTPADAVGHCDYSALGLIDEVMLFDRALSAEEVDLAFTSQEGAP